MHSEKEKDGSDAGSNQLRQDQLQHTVTEVTFSTPMVYLVKFSASHSAVEVVTLEIRQANDLATGSREHESHYTMVSKDGSVF